MSDKVSKFLKKVTAKEKEILLALLFRIKNGDLESMDVKKLKGMDYFFRVRKGDFRIIFIKKEGSVSIVAIEKRSDTTY